MIGLGNLDAFFGRFSRLFLDCFAFKFSCFLDGFLQNNTLLDGCQKPILALNFEKVSKKSTKFLLHFLAA
jgi:hypothetical protein